MKGIDEEAKTGREWAVATWDATAHVVNHSPKELLSNHNNHTKAPQAWQVVNAYTCRSHVSCTVRKMSLYQ